MRVIRRPRAENPRSTRSNRRGSAPLELTMFMPIYAAMLMVLFTIFSFARTRMDVVVEARHATWQQRELPPEKTALLDEESTLARRLGRILNRSHAASGGLVSGSSSGKPSVFLKSLNLDSLTHSEQFVLTDTWDHKTVPFPGQKQHPALTLDPRVSVFGQVKLDDFLALSNSVSKYKSAARGRLNKMRRLSRDARKRQIEEAIEDLRKDIDSLEKSLAEAVPTDLELIADLQRRLDEQTQTLDELQTRLDEYQNPFPMRVSRTRM